MLPAVGKDRALRLLTWYPAAAAAGTARAYRWRVSPPGRAAVTVTFEAIATKGAPPAVGRFPLVVLSHGYGGAPEHLSNLGENLASKGFVVAGIDHADAPFADAAGFQRSFADSARFRARDQQRVLRAAATGLPALRMADAFRAAVVGYSMGGFGALATGGMRYDPKSLAMRSLAPDAMADQTDAAPPEPGLKAVVAIAPWGSQAPYRAWGADGVRASSLPLMVIAGERDEVSNTAGGIRPLFDAAAGAERWLLLYSLAGHNIAGNPAPPEAADAELRGFFDEPVWRTDRLNAINLHFITAFLELTLKGDRSRAALLERPADGAAWPGFPGKFAVGFELVHRAAGQ